MRQDIPPPNRAHDPRYIELREVTLTLFRSLAPMLLIEMHWSELMEIFKDALVAEMFGEDDATMH